MASTLLSKQETAKLKLVCQTVIERAVQRNESGRNAYFECDYCGQSTLAFGDKTESSVEHNSMCPFTAAKELLEEVE